MGTREKKLAAFLERIDARLSGSTRARHRHLAAFTALRPLIEAAIVHGYTMKATWAVLREDGRLSMSYETFCEYCRRAGIRAGSDAMSSYDVFHHGYAPESGDLN